MLLGQTYLVLVSWHSSTFSVVNLCQLDIFVVSNKLLNHHGSSADLDNQVVSQVLDRDLLGSVNIVALIDSLPWHRATELVDVLSQLFVNIVVLDWDVDLIPWSHWLWLSIEQGIKLSLQVSNLLIFAVDLIFECFHLIVELLYLALELGNNLVLLVDFRLLLGKETDQIIKLLLVLSDLFKCQLLLCR